MPIKIMIKKNHNLMINKDKKNTHWLLIVTQFFTLLTCNSFISLMQQLLAFPGKSPKNNIGSK